MTDEMRTERQIQTRARTVQRLRLTVIEGPDRGAVFEPPDVREVSVGTAEDNQLVLHDPKVSRYHLEIERHPLGIHVRDLESSNGTHVGTARIEGAVLHAGTRVSLGDTVL